MSNVKNCPIEKLLTLLNFAQKSKNFLLRNIFVADHLFGVKLTFMIIFLYEVKLLYFPVCNAMFTQLEELESEMNLSQLVKFNTWRRVVNGILKTSLLDHVYENVHGLVENIDEISTSTSDHTPLLIDVTLKICHKVETKVVRNWLAYSKERLLDLLSKTSWEINCHDVQDFNNELEQKVMSVLEILIPFEEIKV
jgi:hypothetical protein